MARGILGTLGLLGTLVFAVPLGFLGVQFLVSERYLMGGVFLGLAVAMVLLQEFLTTPQDIPAMLAEKVTGTVVGEEKPEESKRSE
ncbi:DUF7533 family protein [Halomarina litorea]|uniref:DUF7533 family protein n=1 Tax=Halomarina litorea TaxID=2961595 RepID=UPI0020C35917|nr:hypothetical protein [Halomarina sp. BCD28]